MKPNEQRAPDKRLAEIPISRAIAEVVRMRDEYKDDPRVTEPVNTLNAVIEQLLLLQQPTSERCGECCGHDLGKLLDGRCGAVLRDAGGSLVYCGHRCTVATTGAGEGNSLPCGHPKYMRTRDGYHFCQYHPNGLLVAPAPPPVQPPAAPQDAAIERARAMFVTWQEDTGLGKWLNPDFGGWKLLIERIAAMLPPTEATQVAVEVAAQEIAKLPTRNAYGNDESHVSAIAAIISKHCGADAGEVERLRGEMWRFKMDQLQACESIRDIQQIACPDCQDPIGLHAIDSRIVGCQAGDGSEENPICGCRTLYGEAIQRKARADAIRECRERIDALVGLEWNNGLNAMTGVVDGGYVSKSNALAALESLTGKPERSTSDTQSPPIASYP